MTKTTTRMAARTPAALGGGMLAAAMLTGGEASAANARSEGAGQDSMSSAYDREQLGRHERTEVGGEDPAAVAGYDEALTVESVRQDSDGSFDVLATSSGQRTTPEVSTDLTTVTERESPPEGRGLQRLMQTRAQAKHPASEPR